MTTSPARLTSFAHGGGCGCKLSPAVLREILAGMPAMGATPILALAIVGMPVAKLSPETIGQILSGGANVCAAAGIPVAGGHSIDSVEPIYGLVALGLVHPDRVLTNRGGRVGDVLILTK
ncbi:MAG: AIR synthase related protein, partial [Caulobacteraceae bacterium]